MYFYIKNILKNNFYHNLKHTERVRESLFLRFDCIFENSYFFLCFQNCFDNVVKNKIYKKYILKNNFYYDFKHILKTVPCKEIRLKSLCWLKIQGPYDVTV